MSQFDESIPHCPIFRPTDKEFADFRKFVYSLSRRKDVQEAGVVKVS